MTPSTIQRLDALFAETPRLVGGGPVPRDEIDAAEQALGVTFDADYRAFIERYGGAMVGSLPVFGLRVSEVMAVGDTVIAETRRLRQQGWQTIAGWAVISTDGNGNAIGMATDGHVYLSDHDAQVVVVGSSFEDFVVRLLDERLFRD